MVSPCCADCGSSHVDRPCACSCWAWRHWWSRSRPRRSRRRTSMQNRGAQLASQPQPRARGQPRHASGSRTSGIRSASSVVRSRSCSAARSRARAAPPWSCRSARRRAGGSRGGRCSRRVGSAWRLVKVQRGTFLFPFIVVDNDVQENSPAFRRGDPRCLPSGGRQGQIWHWNGRHLRALAVRLGPADGRTARQERGWGRVLAVAGEDLLRHEGRQRGRVPRVLRQRDARSHHQTRAERTDEHLHEQLRGRAAPVERQATTAPDWTRPSHSSGSAARPSRRESCAPCSRRGRAS